MGFFLSVLNRLSYSWISYLPEPGFRIHFHISAGTRAFMRLKYQIASGRVQKIFEDGGSNPLSLNGLDEGMYLVTANRCRSPYHGGFKS
jgi:hypothetical protein